MDLPEKIIAGYPPEEFLFSGEYSEQMIGHRWIAWRNRVTMIYPIYRAESGKIICPAWLGVKKQVRRVKI